VAHCEHCAIEVRQRSGPSHSFPILINCVMEKESMRTQSAQTERILNTSVEDIKYYSTLLYCLWYYWYYLPPHSPSGRFVNIEDSV
jgi:hypothetical protein